VIMRLRPVRKSWDKRRKPRLGDNAAGATASTAIVGIDGSGGRGVALGSVGGEESSEEIHWLN